MKIAAVERVVHSNWQGYMSCRSLVVVVRLTHDYWSVIDPIKLARECESVDPFDHNTLVGMEYEGPGWVSLVDAVAYAQQVVDTRQREAIYRQEVLLTEEGTPALPA